MKSLIYDGNKVKYSEVNKDESLIFQNPLVIKIERAGICSTDLKIVDGKYYNKDLLKLNGVIGHEGCGYIVETTKDSKFKKGEGVVFETVFPCGICEQCKLNMTNYCSNWQHIGINLNGTFSEYITVDESMTHQLPISIPANIRVLAEPLAIAFNSIVDIQKNIKNKNIEVVIIGPGILGLLHTLLLLNFGYDNVDIVGLDHDIDRLNKGIMLGAKSYFISNNNSSKKKYDLVIDSSNTSSGAQLALQLCKTNGNIRFLNLSTELGISSSDIVRTGAIISTSKGIRRNHMEMACKYISESWEKLDGLVTNVFSPDDFDNAFKFAREQKGIKSVFDFSNVN